MSQALEPYVDKLVSCLTNDGRHIVGTLKGFDQCVNIILVDSTERVYSTSAGVEEVTLGLYLIRGDNLSVIGQIDETADAALQATFADIRCQPLPALTHH
eukprot:NODE_10067_length_611_cov_83.981557_g9793_i0.p1 GENE.NODE_10067_length_611_cov_83.981557_g9793_i0~~NODE_10067_length_611_cov_83.981557_g9793_i0.p1  ORF type:complete len:100 (-),score=6.47 NODE_10067_length_611_cov_83.981557_g9793_i0:245-544(-)